MPHIPGALITLAVLAAAPAARAAESAQEGDPGAHWAFRAPARPPLPPAKDTAWPRGPVDRFILAEMEAASLAPAAEAPRERLLRRAAFDLTGLSPDLEREGDQGGSSPGFLQDRSPYAWERLLDRLLASPAYGERWGRHWLDLARYAESNGFEHDEVRPDAWRYRDYVIRSFNADKPYDRFVEEQIAGDELFPGNVDALVATGFNLLGPDMTDASDQAQRRDNTLSDMTDTAGLVFLGMTIACARCHDHKFEPIPQTDYYRLKAFFTPAAFRRDLPIAAGEERTRHETAMRQYAALARPVEDALAKLEEPYRASLREKKLAKVADEAQVAYRTPEARRTPAQRELVEKTTRLIGVSREEILGAMRQEDRQSHERLTTELKGFDSQKPGPLPVAMGLSDPPGEPPRTLLLERGELSSPGAEVAPGFPAALATAGSLAAGPAAGPSSGRRAALGRWIASRSNPLTARVIANRLWQHCFGRGIVATPSDFGLRGAPPTHPALLDWLAVELVERGWSLKALLRSILSSAAYRQASSASAGALRLDPENRLFTRQGGKRLEGEVIRDAILEATGSLSRKMGGPGVLPPVPAAAIQGSAGWKPSEDPAEHVRRSVYVLARRNLRFPFLEAFDAPDSNLSCPRREQSITAPQALMLLNAPEVLEAARRLEARLEREAETPEARIALVYRLVLGRPPSEREAALARKFLAASPLSELCRALFNVNEFVYVD